MPDFAYTARSLSGELCEGTLTAASQRDALAALSAQDLFPVKVQSKGTVATAIDGSIRVSSRHITPVYSQLSALLRSGVPLLRALNVIREQSSDARLSAVLTDIHDRVEDGATLADAMARHPQAFSELAASIVRAGSEGGFLEDALDRVAAFTDQQDELKSKVTGALAYPMILLVIGVCIVTGLIVYAVPLVSELFERLRERGELPWMTEALLALSDFLSTYGLFVVAAIGIVVYYVRNWLATAKGRLIADQLRLKSPMLGPITRNLAVARFCRVLGTLLRGGVPIVRSLAISADSTGNKVLSGVVVDASENIKSGESLAGPLAASGAFPRDVVEMIAVAEQANSLEVVLEQVADSLERTTWRKIELGVRLLEPLMLLLLATAVLMVVIALLMPIIKASSTM